MNIKTYVHSKPVRFFAKSIVFICLNIIGFYFSYQGFINDENTKLLLSKVNIDQNIEFANTQIKSLSHSLIVKNSLRFATKDVLKSTTDYVLVETKDLGYIEYTSHLKHFKIRFTNDQIQNESGLSTKIEAEVYDASQKIGNIEANLDLGFLLQRLSLSSEYKAKHSTSPTTSLFELCSPQVVTKTQVFYCHEFSKSYLVKEVIPNGIIYLIALLLCMTLLYKFYENISKKLLSKEKQVQAFEQIAHDIKSPITALSIISEAKTLDSRAQPLLKTSVDRLKEIINSNANKTTDKLTEANLDPLIESILKEKMAIRNDITINYSSSLKYNCVLVDPIEMKRIISNLINNSIEAMTDNKVIEITLEQDKHNLKLQIKDHGKGIPKALLSKVFDRTFSYDKKQGSGLGLYHAKDNITKWNGSIQITSLESKGTVVTITLPFIKSKLKA
ncbi:MAG: HAMP domain-containing histidine kinase [Bdellovibrionales bacterium]|nr:HAMP domain-containing histidine kinase [Bdellovibrionales bacterium]